MKYEKITEAKSSGFKKIESEVTLMNSGFKFVGLNPIILDDKILIPTGYIIYKKLGVDEE